MLLGVLMWCLENWRKVDHVRFLFLAVCMLSGRVGRRIYTAPKLLLFFLLPSFLLYKNKYPELQNLQTVTKMFLNNVAEEWMASFCCLLCGINLLPLFPKLKDEYNIGGALDFGSDKYKDSIARAYDVFCLPSTL